jgi:hypothetical protein
MQSVVQFVVEGAIYESSQISQVSRAINKIMDWNDCLFIAPSWENVVMFSLADLKIYSESRLKKKWIGVDKIIESYYPGHNVVRTNIMYQKYDT